MRYELISLEQLPVGRKAALLTMVNGDLHGCVVEQRPDGRLCRREISYEIGSIIRAFAQVMSRDRSDDTTFVVLADGAYWPSIFPAIADRR